MKAKDSSGCCPGKHSSSRPRKSSMHSIAPVRIDVSTLCSRCQSQPLSGGCLRHRCSNCKENGVPRSLSLCKKCSDNLGQCRRCRQPLASKDGSQQPAKQLRGRSSQPGRAARATTCGSCSKTPLPLNARASKCENCKGFTSSTAYKLCPGCSGKLGQCDRCRKPLTGPGAAKPRLASTRRKR